MRKTYIDCREPFKFDLGRWYIKMEGNHNPSYYLVNRTKKVVEQQVMKFI